MTEKRFRGNFQGKMLVSVQDTQRDCNVNILQIIEIANALTDENKRLKKENKGLQSELEIWKKDITHSNNIINRLNDENEQLKQQINDLSKENIHLDARVMDLQERLMNR